MKANSQVDVIQPLRLVGKFQLGRSAGEPYEYRHFAEPQGLLQVILIHLFAASRRTSQTKGLTTTQCGLSRSP